MSQNFTFGINANCHAIAFVDENPQDQYQVYHVYKNKWNDANSIELEESLQKKRISIGFSAYYELMFMRVDCDNAYYFDDQGSGSGYFFTYDHNLIYKEDRNLFGAKTFIDFICSEPEKQTTLSIGISGAVEKPFSIIKKDDRIHYVETAEKNGITNVIHDTSYIASGNFTYSNKLIFRPALRAIINTKLNNNFSIQFRFGLAGRVFPGFKIDKIKYGADASFGIGLTYSILNNATQSH